MAQIRKLVETKPVAFHLLISLIDVFQVILENFEPTQLLFNGFISFLEVGEPVFEELDVFIMSFQILRGISNDGEVVGSRANERDRDAADKARAKQRILVGEERAIRVTGSFVLLLVDKSK